MKTGIYFTTALAAIILFGSCKKSTPASTTPTSVTIITTLPGLSTNPVDSISSSAAICGGNISSEGSSAISAVGVCWDIKSGPTTLRAHTNDGAGVGSYKSYLYGLASNTTYYVRAYATNATGTAYGNEVSFKTPAGWTLVNTSLGLGGNTIGDLAANGSVVYAATVNGVFRSDNQGQQWVGAGLSTFLIRAVAVSGSNIFAATSNNGISLSTDGGATWNPANSGLNASNVSDILVNGNLIMAGTAGNGIFISTNNGTNWVAANSGLTDTYITKLATSGSNFYAATLNGRIYFSSNNGSSWSLISNSLPNSSNLLALTVSGSNVLASFFGGTYISSDNGNVWTKITSIPGSVYSLVAKGNDVFAGGVSTSYISQNNGNIFTEVGAGLSGSTGNVMVSSDSYVLLSDGSRIWKYPL